MSEAALIGSRKMPGRKIGCVNFASIFLPGIFLRSPVEIEPADLLASLRSRLVRCAV
jgi:hypothetical protein